MKLIHDDLLVNKMEFSQQSRRVLINYAIKQNKTSPAEYNHKSLFNGVTGVSE